MSGATIHHLTIEDWKDALTARASVRIFAGLFLGNETHAALAAAAAHDIILHLRGMTRTIMFNMEVELENRPQFVQVLFHGFDVHFQAEELRATLIRALPYTDTLTRCGCTFSVMEKPGLGTAVALTMPAAETATITTADIKAQVPEGMTSETMRAAELAALNAAYLERATVPPVPAASQPTAAASVAPGISSGGLEFIHEELRDTRRSLKAAIERYDALVELKNNLRRQLEDLRMLLGGSSESESAVPGMLRVSDIKDAVKQVAAISAQLESHFQTATEAPAFDISIERFNIEEVFATLQTVFASTAQEKNLDLQFNLDPKIPGLHTDKSRTVRILHHLVDNGLKYTKKGSVIVSAAKTSHKGEVVFTVEDTGIGISQDNHRIIFGEGTAHVRPGSSQFSGLPVAKELVKSLGGKIAVDSQVGQGSKFTIILPVDFDAEPEPDVAAVVSETATTIADPMVEATADKDTAILIVEDDEATQFLMKKILSAEYTCFGAASANEAFAILGKHTIRFIYMDIALRGSIDGIELTRQLRSSDEWKDIPIIALTSFTHDMTRGEALCAGCDDYLTKPINKTEVMDKVREYIRPYKAQELEFLK